MQFVFNDGGREAAGFKGSTGDCVCRAIAIVADLPYREVYDALAAGAATQRVTSKTGKQARSARNGIFTRRKWFKDYMANLGFVWTPTMQIGQGCKVHLIDGELPPGRLVVSVSRHLTSVIDGVVYDTHDPQRTSIEVGCKDGENYRKEINRCVYGYWTLPTKRKVGTIDMTPTWRGLMPALIAAIENGTPAGRQIAIDELNRLANFADNAIANGHAKRKTK